MKVNNFVENPFLKMFSKRETAHPKIIPYSSNSFFPHAKTFYCQSFILIG